MVCLQPNNTKLRKRLARMLRDISGRSESEVDAALAAADNQGGLALAMLMRDWTVGQARAALGQGTLLRTIVDGDDSSHAPGDGDSARSLGSQRGAVT